MTNASVPSSSSASEARVFSKEILVRFSDCDPAGIVFYPKYLEMFNAIIEDWFRDELNCPFDELVGRRGWGLPTVHLNVDFLKPSTYGDVLNAKLRLTAIGRTSITLEIILCGADGATRVEGNAVLVLIERAKTQAMPFPPELRERLSLFLRPATPQAESVSERSER